MDCFWRVFVPCGVWVAWTFCNAGYPGVLLQWGQVIVTVLSGVCPIMDIKSVLDFQNLQTWFTITDKQMQLESNLLLIN